MRVARLSLHDFRSYPEVEIALEPGPTAFVGANGQGKTNLVEAVDYLSRLDSHRVSSDTPLVRAGAERAVVRAEVVRRDASQRYSGYIAEYRAGSCLQLHQPRRPAR